MKLRLTLVALCVFPAACGGSTQAPASPPAPVASVAPAAPAAPAASAAVSATPAEAPAPSAVPTVNAEDAPPTPEDWAKADATAATETARFTPALHAECKALSEKSYPSLKAGLTAVLKSPTRKPGNPERDQYRHPVETLEFFGLTPKMKVLEYSPGEGWYTELLAPLLAKKGKLLVTTTDPNGPKTDRGALGGHREQLMLEKAPECFGKVERVVIDPKKPALAEDGTLDMVLLIRESHGLQRSGELTAWLDAFHHALKTNGILGVVQHRAASGANPDESAKNGYLPQDWLVSQIEKAGFKLAGKSEINANPKDTKDYPEGVWTLPPSFRMKDKDHDKYAAIGESDRMTLKFVKVGK